jgi:hypothetical protein
MGRIIDSNSSLHLKHLCTPAPDSLVPRLRPGNAFERLCLQKYHFQVLPGNEEQGKLVRDFREIWEILD